MSSARGRSIVGRRSSVRGAFALAGVVASALASGLCWAAPAGAATGSAAATTPDSSLAPPAAVLPPGLVALEQKAEALHVNSVSFTALVEMSLEGGVFGLKKGSPFVFPIEGSGAASVSPREESIKAGLFGMTSETRVVGDTTYTHSSAAAKLDKGRPWVRRHVAGAGVDPLSLGAGVVSTSPVGSGETEAGTAAGGSFAGIARAFADATSVTEVGPEIVNGSQATEFSATLNPSKLLEGLSQELAKAKRKLGKLSAQLYVSFAPDGLPVRTSWTIGDRGVRITSTIDITATEVPVSVKAPPADKTIGAARLKKLEARQRRRERARMRRAQECLKRLKHEHPQKGKHGRSSPEYVPKCLARSEAPMRPSPRNGSRRKSKQ